MRHKPIEICLDAKSRRRLVEGHLPATGHRRRHRLSGSPTPFQKPAGIVRCKRLILRRRHRPFRPFQKQVLLGGAAVVMVTRPGLVEVVTTASASATTATTMSASPSSRTKNVPARLSAASSRC